MFPLGTFTLLPGEERDVGLLQLSTAARLTVRVVLPEGAPSGRLHVELVDPADPGANAVASNRWTSLEDGALQAKVPAGEYLLRVRGNGLAAICETVRVTAPETTHIVRCESGEPVELQVGLPPTEDPHAATRVRWLVLDASGKAVVEDGLSASFGAGVERVTRPWVLHLAPGAYRVRAELEDGRAVEAELAAPRPADAGPLLLDLR